MRDSTAPRAVVLNAVRRLHLPSPMRKHRRAESHPAAENIQAIVELEQQTLRDQTFADRLSERISRLIGSLQFVVLHLVWFTVWTMWNTFGNPEFRFDRFPFGLLTFIVSIEGVLIAIFVLIAQNRMSRQSDHRAHLNLQVDLLTEQEMTIVLRLLHRIGDQLGIKPDNADLERTRQLTEQTNVSELMESIKRELPETESPR